MMVDGSKDLAMDTGALLIPYVPAGASKLLKVGIKYGDEAADSLKAFDKANDARKAAEAAAETKKAADAAEAAKKASDAAEAARKAEQAKAVGSVPKPSTGKGTAPPSQRDPQRAFSRGQKEQKLAEQGGKCPGCDKKIEVAEGKGHHVKRHADGGPTSQDNHAVVCEDCHRKLHSPTD